MQIIWGIWIFPLAVRSSLLCHYFLTLPTIHSGLSYFSRLVYLHISRPVHVQYEVLQNHCLRHVVNQTLRRGRCCLAFQRLQRPPTSCLFFAFLLLYNSIMGYCEVNCTLCGVSFAIARLRRADEPFSAAWAYYGEGFTNEDGTGWECSESDCQRITRDGVYGPDYAGDNTGVEHLPSPSCTFASGYNGHRISAEEMKGCRANQCLAKKSFTLVSNQKEWEPEDDDQDFELESDYFLTGAGEGSDAESDVEQITPVRHGVERIYPANIFWDVSRNLPKCHRITVSDFQNQGRQLSRHSLPPHLF